VLRAILHDWDDDRAVAILGNCRKAMTADAILGPRRMQGPRFAE